MRTRAGCGIFINQPTFNAAANLLYISAPIDECGSQYETAVPSAAHGVLAFSVQANCTLALAWHTTVGPASISTCSQPFSTPTLAGGALYVGTGVDGAVHALDALTGRPLWNATVDGFTFNAPAVVSGPAGKGLVLVSVVNYAGPASLSVFG